VAKGAQATARGIGNLAGQTVGGAVSGFNKAAGGNNQQDQQLTPQQQKQQQQQQQLAVKGQQDMATKIKELETALAGLKQSSGL
jgi:Sec-independent protein translocase protein TatA